MLRCISTISKFTIQIAPKSYISNIFKGAISEHSWFLHRKGFDY